MYFFKFRGLHAFIGELLCSYARSEAVDHLVTIETESDFDFRVNFNNSGSDCDVCDSHHCTEEERHLLASLYGGAWIHQRRLLPTRHRLPILLSVLTTWSCTHEVSARWEKNCIVQKWRTFLIMWEIECYVKKFQFRYAFRLGDTPMWQARRRWMLFRLTEKEVEINEIPMKLCWKCEEFQSCHFFTIATVHKIHVKILIINSTIDQK